MMNTCCKVGEAIDKYTIQTPNSFESVNNYLVARWKGHSGCPEASVRTLTKWLNLNIIKSAYRDNGRNTIESRIEADYEILKGSDENEKQDIINDLSVDGIDGELVADSFISPSTLIRHFNNCLGEEKSKNEAEKNSNWEANKIKFAKHAMKNNAQESVNSLGKKGRITGASDANISIPVLLECGEPDCANTCSFDRALNRGYVCGEHDTGSDGNDNIQPLQND